MPDNLPNLLQEIHSVKTANEMASKFDDFRSRIALLIYTNPRETNYYRNHTGRELFRKLYNFGLSNLMTDTYDSGFRPDLSAGLSTFTVSLNGNNGQESGSGNYLIGSSVPILATPDDCYKFVDWVISGPGTLSDPTSPSTSFIVGAGHATVTANYSLKTIFVSVNGDNGVETLNPSQGICGDTVSISATPEDCYQFDRWEVDGPGSINNPTSISTTFTIGSANSTITAIYSLKTFSISTGGNNGTEVLSTTQGVCGDTISILATADDCYKFDSWTLTGKGSIVDSTSASSTFTIGAGDATLTANYSLDTFLVSASGANGTETLSATQGICGDEIHISASPDDCYEFDGWTLDGPGSITHATNESTKFIIGSGNSTLTANYSLKTFHISANGDNGVETLSAITGTCGDSVSISANPESGFVFDNWTLEGEGTITNSSNAETTFTVGAGNAELTANYSLE